MRKLLNLSLVFLAVILFTNCDKDEAFDLSKVDSKVEAKFETDRQTVFQGTSVQFKNTSVYGKTFEWTFEGGSPATSTEESPLITYSELGEYSVSLKITNEYGENTKETEAYITVTDDAGWDDFEFPNIQFTNKTLNGNGALYKQLIPNEQDFIKRVCLKVCVEMYMTASDVNKVNNIVYTVDDSETLSAKGGSAPNISISFSSSYLMQKKNQGLTDAELIREIEGVLVHEITHGYQYEPKGAGDYKSGTDFFGFIEGMADYVRYVEGFTPIAKRKAGGNWNDGYNTTGFFIDWLHSKNFNFLSKFNRTAKAMDPWSWDAAIKEVLGNEASVSALWSEYQSDLASGKITDIDAQLKEKRDKREEVEYNGGSITPSDLIDITDSGCTISRDQSFDSPSGEEIEFLIDNDATTKFLIFTDNTWVKFACTTPSVVSAYSLTSGGDAPGRDPKFWILYGSNDGETWDQLDTRDNQSFADRNEYKKFEFSNKKEYTFYKFEFENTDAAGIFQLSEVELLGTKEDDGSGEEEDPIEVVIPEGVVDITKYSTNVTYKEESFQDWGMPVNLYDGDQTTAFFGMSTTTWFTFETGKKVNVTKLTLSASNNLFGDDFIIVFSPDEWTLSGSNDGENWTEIKKITDTGITAFGQKEEFEFENTEFFTFHKVELTAEEEENGRIVIGELELFGTAEVL